MTGRNELDHERQVSLKLFVVLSKAYKTLMDKATKDMKQYGLSASEFMILEVVSTKRSIPIQQIGEKLLATSGGMTYNIDKLEQKGLLKRVPSGEDRRIINVEATVEGDALFGRIFPEHAEVIHSIVHGLSTEEKQAATELLKKLGTGV